MLETDLLIYHASQLVTCASPHGPKRGPAMRDVGLVQDGAVAITGGKIVAVGTTADLEAICYSENKLDARGKVVCPGFVDAHTHVVFAGDRVTEFEQRIEGRSYMEILAAGGGIISSARSVRAASVEQLVQETRLRLETMLRLGTTTVEVKTGYGLDLENEMKLLDAIAVLEVSQPCSLVPTFLGAHAVPAEYRENQQEYVRTVIETMLPKAAAWYETSPFKPEGIPFFCDVFCELNAFTLEQSRQILQSAKSVGMRLKIHADEFTALGGVSLAVELGATSVDHLDVTNPEERTRLAGSNTLGVVLPAVNFNLGSAHFADARGLIDAGVALALSTDINPGSAPCPSIPLVMATAARYQRLLPSEALIASTINAAWATDLGDRVGSLEIGKQADILILKTPDYRHLSYRFGENLVETVIKKGKVLF